MGATHRKIAKEADIPLGSMTYHFNSIEDVFVATFSCFAEEASSQFESILQAAQTREEAVNAVVEIICGNFWAERQGRALTLSYELYGRSEV
ncbi:TetR/AcrR family transcriptional regulator, partial [Pseudomonas amygdali]